MIFRHLVVGPLEGNCYIIGEEISHYGIIIDPGGEPEKILQVVKETGLTIRFFLATHGHFDHNAAVTQLKKSIDADFLVHKDDLPLLKAGGGAALWNFPMPAYKEPDLWLADGDRTILENGINAL